MSKVVCIIKSKFNTGNFIREVKLIEGENSIQAYAFIDSGNKVNYNGECVSIISINVFMKLFKDIDIASIITGKISDKLLRNIEYIQIGGIGVAKKYLSFVIDRIEVDGKVYKSPRLVLSWKDLGEFDVILHSEYMGGGYEKVSSNA